LKQLERLQRGWLQNKAISGSGRIKIKRPLEISKGLFYKN
jgi:hypothetical protein